MKRKQIRALHQKSEEELEKLILKTQKELAKLRVDFGAGKLKNVSQIRETRQDLARLKTILKERSLENLNSQQTSLEERKK